MPSPLEARQIVRKRLRDDFDFYAENALQIRTKSAEIVPLKLNEAQRRLLDVVNAQWKAEGRTRVIILKARQMGLSTAVGGFLYFRTSQNRAQKALVMTHKAESTAALFDMTKRYYENTPEPLRPSTKYSSKRELKFDKLDSGYMVATAGGEAVARGETLTSAHLSELAFWPKSSAKALLSGILDAIPNTRGRPCSSKARPTASRASSTTFGKRPRRARTAISRYSSLVHPGRVSRAGPRGVRTHPQRARLGRPFRPGRRTAHVPPPQGRRERDRPVSTGVSVNTRRSVPYDRPTRFQSRANRGAGAHRAPPEIRHGTGKRSHRKGPTRRAAGLPRLDQGDPEEKRAPDTYYIGADVAMGVRGGDFSVAQVLDSRKRQVAVWRGHVPPRPFRHRPRRPGLLLQHRPHRR
jgi:hypothetical protein